MSRQIGPIVEILMRRVRQQGGLAVDVDFATEIYTRCEQIINAALKRVLVSDTLTTPKQKLLFNFRDEFPDAIEIVSVIESNRELLEAHNLFAISAYDISWFRNITGTRFESWLQIGRDLLFLYPGQTAVSSVTVEYVKLTTLRTDFEIAYNEDSELPDEDVDLALGLAEVIFLTRFRLLRSIPKKLEDVLKLFNARGFRIDNS